MKLIMESFNKFLAEQVDFDKAQELIDNNPYLKGKLEANEDSMIDSDKYVLFVAEDSLDHVKDRHMDVDAPGSLFKADINLKDTIKNLLGKDPSEEADGRVKWLGVELDEDIGDMGVKLGDHDEVAGMKDYTMPGGRQEDVKIAAGERDSTNKMSLITAELGELDGKKVLSLITAFPGGTDIDGKEMPTDRSQFAEEGFYFVLPEDSPLLTGDAGDDKEEE